MDQPLPTFAECVFLIKKPFYYLPIRPWLLRRAAKQIHLPQQFPPNLEPGDGLIGEALLDGFFELDGERHEFESRNWRFKKASKNWRQNLHAFGWLHHLKATSKDEARSASAAIVLDWCARHSSWRKVAWHSLTTAKRVCNWLSLFDFISSKMTPEQKRTFVTSLWSQILHLNSAYPLDLVGADRLTVAKTLILSDLAFTGSMNNRFCGWTLLERELRRQIMPDGGLIERSASQNLQALIDLIEVRAALRAFDVAVPPTLDLAIRLIGTVVEALKMPDGRLSHHHAGTVSPLLTRALSLSGDVEAKLSFPESGFERLEAKRSVLIMNTGQAETLHFNRHLHAAPLAFEFALGKQMLIVNCGSHPNDDKYGSIERTTAAHSGLAIEDVNALPIVTMKAGAGLSVQNAANVTPNVVRDVGPQHETLVVSHRHYERIGGGLHTRQLQLEEDGEMLIGFDQVSACGKPEICARFHLHPDVLPRIADQTIFLRMPTGRPWRFDVQDGQVHIEDSLYFDQGTLKPTKQIFVKRAVNNGSASIKWSLAREGRAARQTL
ncbi:MAG: heparinase II/III family protein [Alphaproteobacteria bacterium]